jgi:DNA-binding NarL/FixJ family response regulator
MVTPHLQDDGIRVVAADDNRQVLDKVVQLLKSDFDVVGTAADGKAALELALLLEPEVVVLDISMPIMSGIQVAAELRKNSSTAKVVFLTVHHDPDFVRAALGVGASCYVVKSHMAADLHIAMRAALNGKKFISPACAVAED